MHVIASSFFSTRREDTTMQLLKCIIIAILSLGFWTVGTVLVGLGKLCVLGSALVSYATDYYE